MRAADYIEDEYRKKIAHLIEEYGSNNFPIVTWKDSLKYTLLHDHSIKVDIVSPTCFDIYCEIGGVREINTSNILSSRISDYISNSRRIKQQYKTAEAMSKNPNMAAPWILVSTYYSSFFAANELLRLYDQLPLGLDGDEFNNLSHKAISTNGINIEDFINRKSRNFIGRIHDDYIRFDSTGDRPHQAAWGKVAQTLTGVMREKGWPELSNYIYFAKGEKGWTQPSDLRNSWNYKRADLYSAKGHDMCKRMFSHLGNFNLATEWFNRATPYDETTHCTALSATTEFLVCPVIKSYESLFETKILSDR